MNLKGIPRTCPTASVVCRPWRTSYLALRKLAVSHSPWLQYGICGGVYMFWRLPSHPRFKVGNSRNRDAQETNDSFLRLRLPTRQLYYSSCWESYCIDVRLYSFKHSHWLLTYERNGLVLALQEKVIRNPSSYSRSQFFFSLTLSSLASLRMDTAGM